MKQIHFNGPDHPKGVHVFGVLEQFRLDVIPNVTNNSFSTTKPQQ